jgi:hypothetical protein
MTAPLRRNGREVAATERMCASKSRYPDELTARAAGQHYREHNETKPLFVYRCPNCRGYHLTKAEHAPRYNVEYDFRRAR